MAKARNIVALTPNEAKEIRERVAAGEKQIDLARLYCVDKSTISKIVKGTMTPNLPRLTPEIVEALEHWKSFVDIDTSEEHEYVSYVDSALVTCQLLYELLKQNDAV